MKDKMDKLTELEKTLAECQAKIDALRAEMDQPEPEWPQEGDDYWSWKLRKVYSSTWENDEIDDERIHQHLIFRTQKEAEDDYEFFHLWREMIAESDGGDWEIYFDDGDFYISGNSDTSSIFTPKFSVKYKAEEALKKFRPRLEKFKDYLKNKQNL